jgi:FKBP-type peptidyl-prolyl cis-trans isomerase SlyD
MKIQDQAVVTMTYVLRENDENGPILQETTKENPFVAIFGMHQLLPKFEENLMGKEPGDHYAFHLTPEEGYGERDEAYVMDLDKNMFMQNNVLMDMVKVGAQLMMQTSDGRPIAGIVREIGDNHVKMDFNHDMAGKHLHFSGEILDVRESTDEDFGAGGCAGCGGDCGEGGCEGCGGGCN